MNFFEVQKAKPGPELDKLVAERIGTPITCYSTDLNLALAIIWKTKGHLLKQDDEAYEGFDWKIWWWPERQTWIVDAQLYGEWAARSSSAKLPLAICRAYLMACLKAES